MCGTILNERAQRLERTSIIPLTAEESNSIAVLKQMDIFERVLGEMLKDRVKGLNAGKDAMKMMDEQGARNEHVP